MWTWLVLAQLSSGVVTGALTALAALGLTMAFGLARFVNVAHGDLVTLGAYASLLANAAWGWPAAAVVPVAVATAAGASLAIYELLLRRLSGTGPLTRVIVSIGVALIVRHLIILGWGAGVHHYRIAIQRAVVLVPGLAFTRYQLATLASLAAAAAGLYLFLYRTRLGREMRAMADSAELARAVGIRADRVQRGMWAIAGGLAGLAGVFLGLTGVVSPYMGWNLLLPAFAGAILGGIGHPMGALAGGMLVGVVSELSTVWLRPTYKMAVTFVVLGLALWAAPTGLFGQGRDVR